MTNRRSTGNVRAGENRTQARADLAATHLAPASPPNSSDLSGRLALVLAAFALGTAAFLILLVVIAASNA